MKVKIISFKISTSLFSNDSHYLFIYSGITNKIITIVFFIPLHKLYIFKIDQFYYTC